MNVNSVSVELGGRPIVFETGKYAGQATGAVTVRQGDSVVLVTAVIGESERNFDFLPLTVDYQDRTSAYGRIPGGYLKREGRSNERETLVSRLIDRPVRPLFPKHFRSEIQIIATTLSYDVDADTDVLSICGASAALWVGGAPISQPIAGVRIVRVGNEFHLNPSQELQKASDMRLVVAGTKQAVVMVEGGSDEVSEAVLIDALEVAHGAIKEIIAAIESLREQAGKPFIPVPPPRTLDEHVKAKVFELGNEPLIKAMGITGKHERKAAIRAARDHVIAALVAEATDAESEVMIKTDAAEAWDKLVKALMRRAVIEEGVRIDGRATDEVRPIWCEVGIAPRAHGSSVFTRGETQVYASIALGTDYDAQRIEHANEPEGRRPWMLTYYFQPYCTGETYPLRGPKRREIGHGALAHRAIEPVLPTQEQFPYVLRSTAEVFSSNGSSSMGTVCSTTMALMDAGVPIKAPVAGIAMGLIVEGDDYAVLSDILGDEDHMGDMDFKVTGTEKGVTALQMDVKIAGVSREIMSRALAQAREGRLHILGEMAKTIGSVREDLSAYAPRITSIQIKPDRIRDIIGPGGRVIRGIQEQTGTKITVDDTGKVDVAATDRGAAEKAIGMIRELTQEAEIGKLYVGVVKRITDFGAFVEIFPGTDGLIHISHLAKERVEKVTDVVNEGDEVLVRVIDIDKAGKIRLSRKEAIESAGAF
ncbi:MAG: polyribonucleotide nucleotidyltransferase [Pseudomonadota bacterium]